MSQHKNVTKAASLMLVAILLSRILGFVREILMARQFGQTGIASAYTSAFNIPDLLYFFLSSGALSSAFIPVFTERFNTGREKEAWQIFSIIACFMGLVLTGAIILAWIFAKPLVIAIAVPGFVSSHPELIPLTTLLTRIILPCQLFFFLGGLMMGTLESRQNFKARAAGPVIYNIGIIIGFLLFAHWFGISGVAVGTLIGAFAGNVIYTFYSLKKEGFQFYPSLNIKHPGVIKVAQLALPVILGLSLPQIDVIINRWFASFVSDSAPAAINYANRLMQVPLGIFAQAAGTAILPTLAAYAAAKAFKEMRSTISYGLRTILLENIPATIFMVVMADPIVRAAYMGEKFLPGDVPLTENAFIFYSVGVFAWAGQAIVARGFFALQDTKTPILIGTICTIIFIPLNYLLMKVMGTGGLALSTSIAVTLHFIALIFALRKRLNGIEGSRILRSVTKVVIAAAVMGVVCFGIRIGMSRIVGSPYIQQGDINRIELLSDSLSFNNNILSSNGIPISLQTKEALVKYNVNKKLKTDFTIWLKELSITSPTLFKIFDDCVNSKSFLAKHLSVTPNLSITKQLAAKDTKQFDNLITRLFNNKKCARILKKNCPSSLYKRIKHLSDYPYTTLALEYCIMKDINSEIKKSNNAVSARKEFESKIPYLNKRPFTRVESKLASVLTVLAAMFIGGIVYFGLLKLMKSEEVDEVLGMIKRKVLKKRA